MDSPEAVSLAPYFLPESARFGRAGKPDSHWLYYVSPAAPAKTQQFKAPHADGSPGADTVVEIRSTGGQTVFPGSIHPSGEWVAWSNWREPARIDAGDLARRVGKLAAACVFLRSWATGGRHTKALRIPAGLLRDGWEPDEVRDFMTAILECAGAEADGSSGGSGDSAHAVESTIEAFENGSEGLQGWKSLEEDGFLTPREHRTIRKWVGAPSRATDGEGAGGLTAFDRAVLATVIARAGGRSDGGAPAAAPLAPAPFAAPVATAAPAVEPITRDAAARLARRFERSADPDRQRVGRSLGRALAGERFAAEGTAATAAAAELAETIAGAFPRGSVADAVALLRVALERANLDPEAFGACVSESQARRVAAIEASGLPLIVQRENTFWFRRKDSDDFARNCKAADFRVVLREMYAGAPGLRDAEGMKIEVGDFLEVYSRHVRSNVCRYDVNATHFDPTTGVLTEGVRPPEIEAVFDSDVERYFDALVGAENKSDLYEWIASTRQDRISHPAAALAFIGAPGTGKSVFATAIASLWGQPSAVAFKQLTRQFLSETLENPILFADEQMPEKMTQADFSTIVQVDSRLVERKGIDAKTMLIGCFRVLIAANGLDRLRLDGSSGPDAVKALADRFAIFHVCSESDPAFQAAKAAISVKQDRLDLSRIVKHFRWVQDNVEPKEQRFYGARSGVGGAAGVAAVLAGEAEKHAEIMALIQSYLEDAPAREAGYVANVELDALRGRADGAAEALRAFPFVTFERQLWVRPAALSIALRKDLAYVQGAIRPLVAGSSRPLRFRGVAIRMTPLDVGRVDLAIPELDRRAAVAALATDTKVRLGDVTA